MYSEIESIVNALKAGKTILYPTDTVWGLGCDATNEAAIKKIYQIKERDDAKSLIILLDSVERLQNYVTHLPQAALDIIENATKPTTIIYPSAKNLPHNLVNANGSIAIRITKDPFCKAIIEALNQPLVSTSANISGHPTAPTFNDIETEIKARVDYIVTYRQEDTATIPPSTIIKINENSGEIEYIRR